MLVEANFELHNRGVASYSERFMEEGRILMTM